ncbi:CinA family protein [Arundinibacter roseus]|uniref:Nicotinamide-nucleotide amidohydrolase family protein n=1 Tax=Arundinibacter roseus TaxID=2070510 RepID=A0A4V2X828_9BACT|nr:nicotinamide-nucleotide amidohydrolase family protein [Arundinibacter roseus]TDB58215.1 nicotinamide-nucleotide amidohydrolase family protein [Arundinibacter roseus]
MASEEVKNLVLYLRNNRLTISFAESATTGRFINEFTSIPNCGSVVQGSIVCYDVAVKKKMLNVTESMLDQFTAESAEVTQQMADELRILIPADLVLAVTGLASPGGSETTEKPVGTMFVHGYIGEKAFRKRFVFDGEPDEIIRKTIDATAVFLLEELQLEEAIGDL